MIGAPVLCLFLFLTFAGMDWVTRVQKALLVLLIFAQVFLDNAKLEDTNILEY